MKETDERFFWEHWRQSFIYISCIRRRVAGHPQYFTSQIWSSIEYFETTVIL